MANWYYYTDKREKIGPIEGKALKQLVQQGIITPETFVEDPTGRTGLAKDVEGLKFAEASSVLENPSTIAVPLPPEHPIPAPPPAPKQVFCTNCGNAVSEQAVACMSCGARPTGHKKFCRQCGVALNPEQVICVKCGVAITGGSTNVGGAGAASIMSAFQTPGVPLEAKQRKERILFWMVLCIATFVIYTLLGIANYAFSVYTGIVAENLLEKSWKQEIWSGFDRYVDVYVIDEKIIANQRDARLVVHAQVLEKISSALYFVYGLYILSGITYLCFYFFYLRQLWEEVPEKIARTTPINAAGFALIPLFHLYWQFVAFAGLLEDMNKAVASYGLSKRREKWWGWVVCSVWVFLYALGIPLGCCISILPFTPGDRTYVCGGFYLCFGLFLLFSITHAAITIWAYWRIRKDVLEFVDIKSSVGK